MNIHVAYFVFIQACLSSRNITFMSWWNAVWPTQPLMWSTDRTKYMVDSADHIIRLHFTSTKVTQHLSSWFLNGISSSSVKGMILLQHPRESMSLATSLFPPQIFPYAVLCSRCFCPFSPHPEPAAEIFSALDLTQTGSLLCHSAYGLENPSKIWHVLVRMS